MMRVRTGPLLAELHAHTTWSDGDLSMAQIVDVYGSRGFDVLCITDHVVRTDDPWLDASEWGNRGVRESNHAAYLEEIRREAARALSEYDLLVVPGLELTYNHLDPAHAAHAVAVGISTFVSVDDGIAEAIEKATMAGAAIIAAHPFNDPSADPGARVTCGFALDASLREHVHRYELFNRSTLFGWVAEAGLPAVASGDFHRLEHLPSWKTLVPCGKGVEPVIEYLRSPRPVYLTRAGLSQALLAA